MSTQEQLAAHEAKAQFIEAQGIRTAVWSEGQGEPVVCLHGVPVSAWLYRNLLPELAARGLRGIAFDYPGAGLADRPTDFGYTWTDLGRFATAAIDALGLDRVHLVIHDIGGPVGFEVAAALGERVASITVLNTLIRVTEFTKPWVMRPFEMPVIKHLWLAGLLEPMFVELMYRQGISPRDRVSPDEIRVHRRLIFRGDGGRAFLRTMGGFETTAAKQAQYVATFTAIPQRQVIWGTRDPALTLRRYGAVFRELVDPERFFEVDGKHFFAETHAPFIAERVAVLARGT